MLVISLCEHRIASLDTLLEQEDKYIEILVGKILKLEPDLLMVGKGVSGQLLHVLRRRDGLPTPAGGTRMRFQARGDATGRRPTLLLLFLFLDFFCLF